MDTCCECDSYAYKKTKPNTTLLGRLIEPRNVVNRNGQETALGHLLRRTRHDGRVGCYRTRADAWRGRDAYFSYRYARPTRWRICSNAISEMVVCGPMRSHCELNPLYNASGPSARATLAAQSIADE